MAYGYTKSHLIRCVANAIELMKGVCPASEFSASYYVGTGIEASEK